MTKSTTKKAASTKSKDKQETAEQTEQQSQTGRAGDSGPGTGVEAPPETTARPPATVVDSESAPLDPPADSGTQTEPEQGHNASSTDHVYAEAGGRTIAGEDHLGLVDAEGNDLSAEDLFDDPDPGKTFVVTKTRVYEEFYYPNTTEVARRLLFAEGRRVPRAQAERIKAAAEAAPEPAAAGREE